MSDIAALHYKLLHSSDLAGEFCRIGLAELEFACKRAEQIVNDPQQSVHLCRKSIKRLRALLRLVRTPCDDDWAELDRLLSEVGRQLAGSRDADVLGRTVATLHGASSPPADAAQCLRGSRPDQRAVDAIVNDLETIKPSLGDFLSHRTVSLVSVEQRIDQSFRSASKRRQEFEAHGRPDDAHRWRKAVQRLANQMRLVADFIPAAAGSQLVALDELARNLGDHHDLTHLLAALASGRVACRRPSRSTLETAAKARQHELGHAALGIARQLFPLSGPAGGPRLVADPIGGTAANANGR